MKLCKECFLEKSNNEFYVNRAKCKTCYRLKTSSYKTSHKKEVRQRNITWNMNHIEHRRIYSEKYNLLNINYIRSRTLKYLKNNLHKCNAIRAKYMAAKLHATPEWLTKDHFKEIEEFYLLAKELAWLNQDGKTFHVDHIIPLQGENISGLHVPWNLQLLPASFNIKKSNKSEIIIVQ